MTRGEIWLVDFGVPLGSEAGYRRPAVVVPKKDSGLTKDSVVIIPLVTTVNKFAFIEKLSVMPKSYMKKICAGVIEVLELNEGL